MNTRVLPASDAAIREAAARIRSGELVAFPTETVYGLGANGLDARRSRGSLRRRGRPGDNPLILHICSPEQLRPLIDGEPSERGAPDDGRLLAGAADDDLPKSARVPANVTAGLDTVAIRLPLHPVARKPHRGGRRAGRRAECKPLRAPQSDRRGACVRGHGRAHSA